MHTNFNPSLNFKVSIEDFLQLYIMRFNIKRYIRLTRGRIEKENKRNQGREREREEEEEEEAKETKRRINQRKNLIAYFEAKRGLPCYQPE